MNAELTEQFTGALPRILPFQHKYLSLHSILGLSSPQLGAIIEAPPCPCQDPRGSIRQDIASLSSHTCDNSSQYWEISKGNTHHGCTASSPHSVELMWSLDVDGVLATYPVPTMDWVDYCGVTGQVAGSSKCPALRSRDPCMSTWRRPSNVAVMTREAALTRAGSSLRLCVCRTTTLFSMLCTVYSLAIARNCLISSVSPEVLNWIKVCCHTSRLLITQISLPDSALWQDHWDVLSRNWMGLTLKRLF